MMYTQECTYNQKIPKFKQRLKKKLYTTKTIKHDPARGQIWKFKFACYKKKIEDIFLWLVFIIQNYKAYTYIIWNLHTWFLCGKLWMKWIFFLYFNTCLYLVIHISWITWVLYIFYYKCVCTFFELIHLHFTILFLPFDIWSLKRIFYYMYVHEFYILNKKWKDQFYRRICTMYKRYIYPLWNMFFFCRFRFYTLAIEYRINKL